MKKQFVLSLAGLLMAGVLISGCQTTTEPVEEELEAIRSIIESDPLFSSDDMLLNDPDAPTTAGKAATPIIPVLWGRRVSSASRNFDFVREGDTVVIATITHSITGEIKIAAADSVGDTTLTLITKPFTESTTRKVKLIRIGRTDRPRDNWRVREVSAMDGGTQGTNLAFTQLVAIIGQDTLSVTDPLNYWMKLPGFTGRRTPVVGGSAAATLRLTLTSTESDTDFVFVHRPFMRVAANSFRPLRARMRLVSQTGSGPYVRVYEYTWNSHITGRHHIFVGGMTRSSLFDDVAPWTTKVWGVPYIVQ